jgi:transcriptional regulator with XRE-family HTH domain
MPRSFSTKDDPTAAGPKAPVCAMTEDRKYEVIAQLTDDVLSKLTGAFFDVCTIEHWTKRDLSTISGINETAINHILAGRRKNLTVETIALLARAMGVRPELILHDTRPTGNHMPSVRQESTAAEARAARQPVQRAASTCSALVASGLTTGSAFLPSAQMLAYAQPDLENEEASQ